MKYYFCTSHSPFDRRIFVYRSPTEIPVSIELLGVGEGPGPAAAYVHLLKERNPRAVVRSIHYDPAERVLYVTLK